MSITSCQPHLVNSNGYRYWMDTDDPKNALRENTETLMRRWYGGPNKLRLGQDTGISNGGAQRVLAARTNVGIHLVQAIARRAGLATWQMLVPKLDPDHPPRLQACPGQPQAMEPEAPYRARNEAESELLQLFRGMTQQHREDLLVMASRWYASDLFQPRRRGDK